MVYVIQVCRQLSSRRIRMELSSTQLSSTIGMELSSILFESCLQTCMTYTIVCTVKNSWWWTEELSETCRVSFQNKFENLVHLFGFIIRICHDARSREFKKKCSFVLWNCLCNEIVLGGCRFWRWGSVKSLLASAMLPRDVAVQKAVNIV
jgi:hypothetical protein